MARSCHLTMHRVWMSSTITLRYITSFHTPVTPTVTNGASTKLFKVLRMRAWKGEFSIVFWKSQYLWVPGDWTGGNSTPSVQRRRNTVHRTLVSTVEVHIGNCWMISVSHDQAGQPRMSSCPTGTQDCDQLSPSAWVRRACRQYGTWSGASVGYGVQEWCGPSFLLLQQVWPPRSEPVEVDQS